VRISPPLRNRFVLILGSLLAALLAGCQDGTLAVVLNGSGEDVEVAFANSKIRAPKGNLICSSRGMPIMKSKKLFRRPSSISTLDDWSPETSHIADESSCSVTGLKLKSREAVAIQVRPACSDFEEQMRRRGVGLEEFTPPYDRMTIQGRSGQLNLTGWQITSRLKRVKREVCVLEITQSDLQK
jgi:hypothetical protein